MHFTGIGHDELDAIWPHVVEHVINALEYADGKYKQEDILDELRQQTMQLWVAYTRNVIYGVVITEILNYPQDKRVRMSIVSGQCFDEWRHFEDIIIGWAKELGCTKVETCGRPGWTRKLKPHYEVIHTILRRDI